MDRPSQSNLLIPLTENNFPGYAEFTEDVSNATKLIEQQIAKGTKRVYKSDWLIFSEWCFTKNMDPIKASAEIVSLFLASQFKNGFHPSTLRRRLAAIKFYYNNLKLISPTDNPIVRATLKGIRRDETSPPTKSKKAATVEIVIEKLLCHIPTHTLHGIRDRALLLLGFAGGFRRSELIALDFEDIVFYPGKGADILLKRSKTDQEGEGSIKSIVEGKLHCPIQALKKWLDIANINFGPIFRPVSRKGKIGNSRLYINNIYYLLKRCARLANLPSSDFSPHSLRSGFITSASEQGCSLEYIMAVSLHKDPRSVLKYIRHPDRFINHAGKNLL